MLNYVKDFYHKNRRVPTCKDFDKNSEYPSFITYQKRFGSWENALLLTGIYIEKNEKDYIDDNKIRCVVEDDLLDILSYADIKNIIRMERERKYNIQYEKQYKRQLNKQHNIKYNRKYTDCRNGNLDPNSSLGKGYITEILVAKFLGIKTCFDLTNNFSYPKYDMFEHEDWGLINVKGSTLMRKGNGSYQYFSIRKNTRPDFFFCIGYDENRKHVKSIHIIPNECYVSTLHTICIPYSDNSKWDIFKEREDEVKKWDDLFHTLKLENCPVLRHDTTRIRDTQ